MHSALKFLWRYVAIEAPYQHADN